MSVRPRVVAFDIIGTVFSLAPLGPKLAALGLPTMARELLYTATLRDTFALAASNGFAPFPSVMANCLDELLAMHDLTADANAKRDVVATMKVLPAHADAGAAFAVLRDGGIRIVALSNGPALSTAGLLDAAGLAPLVERVLSVEDVKLSKPRPEVYRYAAETAGVAPDAMALVAMHPWDVHGAKAAGLIGAYVARGLPYASVLTAPDVTGETLLEVARALTQG